MAPLKPAYIALDVKSRDGTRLTLTEQRGETAVQQDLLLTETTRVERLRPITPDEVKAGDWVTLIGIPNEVKSFAIHTVVVVPGAGGEQVDGAMRSPAGFLGHEVSRNPNDRPLLGGIIQGVQGKPCPAPTGVGQGPGPGQPEAATPTQVPECSDIQLTVSTGSATVHIMTGARFYRLESVAVDDVKEGDRIAGVFSGPPPAAVLVLPNEGG
ncbi:MAG: hypothetical protein ACKVT1_06295 [Dehalococcoidia bacterium]